VACPGCPAPLPHRSGVGGLRELALKPPVAGVAAVAVVVAAAGLGVGLQAGA
jgi:hypothetical protein